MFVRHFVMQKFCLSLLIHDKPYTVQQREKKQCNRTDKANSSYSRPKNGKIKRK